MAAAAAAADTRSRGQRRYRRKVEVAVEFDEPAVLTRKGLVPRIEIEGVEDMQRIDEQVIAALHIDQKVRRKDVELPERCQTLRLDAEIAERSGKRGPQPITRRRGLTTRVERVAQRNLEPLPDALENRIDLHCTEFLAGRPGLGIGVERGPAAAGERK